MRKTLPSFFALSLALGGLSLAGCTTKKVTEVTGSTITPAVASVSPETSYRGRTLDVQLTGSGTAWDASTTIAFGAGVTVNKITIASPAALVANITVADDATIGEHDVTVTDGKNAEPYKMLFNVQSPITATVTGTVAQGSVLFLKIKNNDTSNPFDTTATGDGFFTPLTFTNIVVTGSTGVEFQVSNVTANEIDATATVDTTTAPGPLDIEVKSGPTDGSGPVADSKQSAAATIAARTATALTSPTTATIADAGGSQIYTYTPKAVGDSVSIGTSDSGGASQIVVFSPSVTLTGVIATGASGTSGTSGKPAKFTSTSTAPVYVLVYDGAQMGSVTATVTVTDITFVTQAGGEGNDVVNNMSAGATLISAPPAKLTGASLSSVTDVDWYKVVVPAGKVIHVQTIPGDANTDTFVTFYGTDGTTVLGTSADKTNHEDATSDALPGAGTYFFKISYSSDPMATPYAAGNSHYDLLVDLE